MKLKPTYLATLFAAAASAGVSTSALAGGDFEFHGYFRSGALFDAQDSFTQYDAFLANKLTVGRLGLEENNFELAFSKGWSFDDGKSVKIHARLANQTADNSTPDSTAYNTNNAFGLSTGPQEIGFNESWVELNGINGDKDFRVWAGKRLYQRPENYSFISDIFYTDYAGTGIGFQGLALGGGKLEFAWITSDRYLNNEDVGFCPTEQCNFDANGPVGEPLDGPVVNLQEVLHLYHVGYEIGGFNTEFAYKRYPTNGDTDFPNSFVEDRSAFAEDGWEISVMYNFPNFFGFANGFSKVVAQYGQDLSTGNLLGGSFTRLSGFRALSTGERFDLAVAQDGDSSLRLIAHGGWIGSNLMVFPHVMYEETEFDAGGTNKLTSFIVRPVLPMPQYPNFMVIIEAGHAINDNDGQDELAVSKLMFAPTFVMGTGEGPAPEIRLLLGMVDSGDVDDDNAETTIVGFQADLWW